MSHTAADRLSHANTLLVTGGVTAAEVAAYVGQDMNSNPKRHAMMCALREASELAVDEQTIARRWVRWLTEWRHTVVEATSVRNDR